MYPFFLYNLSKYSSLFEITGYIISNKIPLKEGLGYIDSSSKKFDLFTFYKYFGSENCFTILCYLKEKSIPGIDFASIFRDVVKYKFDDLLKLMLDKFDIDINEVFYDIEHYIRDNEIEKVEEILQLMNMYGKIKEDNRYLQCALYYNNYEITELFLQYGFECRNLTYWCCCYCDYKMLKMLEKNTDIKYLNDLYYDCFIYCLICGNLEILKMLMNEKKINFSIDAQEEHRQLFIDVASKGFHDIIKFCNEVKQLHFHPYILENASEHSHYELSKYLIEFTTEITRRTLDNFIRDDKLELIKMILNKTRFDGNIFVLPCVNNNLSIIELFLENGYKPCFSSIAYVLRHYNVEILKLFIKYNYVDSIDIVIYNINSDNADINNKKYNIVEYLFSEEKICQKFIKYIYENYFIRKFFIKDINLLRILLKNNINFGLLELNNSLEYSYETLELLLNNVRTEFKDFKKYIGFTDMMYSNALENYYKDSITETEKKFNDNKLKQIKLMNIHGLKYSVYMYKKIMEDFKNEEEVIHIFDEFKNNMVL